MAPTSTQPREGHEADHRVTLSREPEVFDWRAIQLVLVVNTVISLAKTFIDGTYHGRGRARRHLYLEEFTYRFHRRHLGTRIAVRLIVACLSSPPCLTRRKARPFRQTNGCFPTPTSWAHQKNFFA